MGSSPKKLQQRKAAQKALDDLFERPDTVNVIHYSCESFYDRNDGTSPRITSIAVHNLGSSQTKSFSIHQTAEIRGFDLDDIEENYDELEKAMLNDFYTHVDKRNNYRWLHWNMRDSNYGFEAIAHRFRVLNGKTRDMPDLPQAQRYDLAVILSTIYGPEYTGHPRMQTIMKRNNITDKDFLKGSEEAEAFESKDFVRLHQSTLRKVQVISNIAELAWRNELDTQTPLWKFYGLNLKAWVEEVTEHWMFKVLGALALGYTLYEISRVIGLF